MSEVQRLMKLADAWATAAIHAALSAHTGCLTTADPGAARSALEAALREALDRGPPAAYIQRPKVPRHPKHRFIRGCYEGAPDQERYLMAEADGDEIIPLYT